MGHRNMLCTNDMMDQQGQGYLYHGPPIRIAATNFQPPNIRTMANPNYEGQYLPERHDGALFYGTVQYNGVHHHHHHHHHHRSFYPPFVPVASDQLSSSSSGFGVVGSGSAADEFGRSNYYFVDGKTKVVLPESSTAQGNYPQHFNASASSVLPPMAAAARHHPSEGVSSVSEAVAFPLAQYNAGMHEHGHIPRGSFAGQHFQPSGGIWLEQQHIGISSSTSASADGAALLWNQGPSLPFMHAPPPMEAASIGMARHHETIRSSQTLRQAPPPPVNPRHHHAHHASPPPRPLRESAVVTPTTTPHRPSSRANRALPHNNNNSGLETGAHRHAAGPALPTGIRIYRPHRGGAGSDASSRHHQNLAQLRYLRVDEVAILEIPDYYEIGDYTTDHHSDMRLDIEDMSYEELLALGERIGKVNTGLSEETIAGQLKTAQYLLSPEESERSDKEAHRCIICQDNYKNFEKVSVLDCGHDYHTECVTKWLVIKNVCPICKSEALKEERF